MKVLFIEETIHRCGQPKKVAKERSVLIVEDDGTEDGGRIIGRIIRKEDAWAIAEAMGWDVTYDDFLLKQ